MHLIYLRLAPLSLDILGAPGQEQRGSECVCVCERERYGAYKDTKEFSSLLMTFVLYSLFYPFIYCDEMKSIFCGRSMQIILIAAN